jgi:hypothetical protein
MPPADLSLMAFKEQGIWYFLCSAPEFPYRIPLHYLTYGPPPPQCVPPPCGPYIGLPRRIRSSARNERKEMVPGLSRGRLEPAPGSRRPVVIEKSANEEQNRPPWGRPTSGSY